MRGPHPFRGISHGRAPLVFAAGFADCIWEGFNLDANKISKYRSEIMGFAILWIMVYHSRMSFSFFPIFGNAINDLRNVGYGGVDLFLFVSGFGIYRSLTKSSDQLAFYKRRLCRILPAYVPVLAVFLFLNRSGISPASWPRVILSNLTGTSFWRGPGPSFNWYMPALFSFYFIAPFFFRTIRRPRGTAYIIVATLVLDVCFYGNFVMIAITRFTIFALGMAFGYWNAEGRKNIHFEWLIYVLGALSYCLLLFFHRFLSGNLLWNGGFYWYPYIFITPALICLLCRLFSWMECRTSWLRRFFEVTGKCSLEIYLIHIVAFEYIHPQSNKIWPFIYAAMVICGFIYHTILAKILVWLPSVLRLNRTEQKTKREIQTDSKKTYIEFIRIVAAFLVIVNHTNSSIFLSLSPSPTWLFSLTYFFICKIAVPLFLIIMGALLLGKEDTPAKTRARLFRIIAIFAAGSLFYYFYYSQRNGTEFSFKQFLLNLPKAQSTNAFWYLYLYIALLCMLPILQKLVKSLDKQQLKYLLILSLGILGTAPLISIFFSDFQLSGDFSVGLIGVYIGQVLLGYFIEQYVPMTKQVFWGAFVCFTVLIVFQVGGTFLLYRQDPTSYLALDNRTLITITVSSAAFFICVKYLFTKHPPYFWSANAICRLGSLTFGIYLLGDMVISQSRSLYGVLSGLMHPLAAMIIWEVFIFVVCALISAGLRLIPFLRKWL